MTSSLNRRLDEGLDDNGKLEIISTFWRQGSEICDLPHYTSYLEYYKEEAVLFRRDQANIHRNADLTFLAHRDLLDCVSLISQNRFDNLARVCAELSRTHPWLTQTASAAFAKLAVRLWLTLNVRSQSSNVLTLRAPYIDWEEGGMFQSDINCGMPELTIFTSSVGDSLIGLINKHFIPSPASALAASNSIDRTRTLARLRRECSIDLRWTSCLRSHLSYVESGSKRYLLVYEYRTCLVNHLNQAGSVFKNGNESWTIYEPELLQETLWTIDLLLPPGDELTSALLRNRQHSNYLPSYQEPPNDLMQYKYWRERLAACYQLFDQDPRTISEYFHKEQPIDKVIQFYSTVIFGFILALVFGIISSVTGILSTKAAIESVEVSRRSLIVAEKALLLQQQQQQQQQGPSTCTCS